LIDGFLKGRALPSGDLVDVVLRIEGESGCNGDGAVAAFEGAIVYVLVQKYNG